MVCITLFASQKNRCTIDEEYMALAFVLQNFNVWVASLSFALIVSSGHDPFVFLWTCNNKNRLL